MQTTLKFTLTRAAKAAGGDLYEALTSENEFMMVYVPQIISRPEGKSPKTKLVITIESEG